MRAAPAFALLALCALPAMTAVADTDVWMWKDATGTVHYSDVWVEGAQRVKASVPKRNYSNESERPDGARSPSASTSDASAPSSTVRAVQQDVAAKRDEQCKRARDNYEKSVSARRIYKSSKDGEREYMSDAEADQYRVKARTDMDEACGGATKQ
jgi:hypothetical protein